MKRLCGITAIGQVCDQAGQYGLPGAEQVQVLYLGKWRVVALIFGDAHEAVFIHFVVGVAQFLLPIGNPQ